MAAFALALPAGAPAQPAKTADGLLIVDCLLPGRVQRLGTQATYVTARRAVKTTAADCGIRGGEYTASDRATYSSSMRVWLPLAKAGDAEAQTNLGEIFEKGLGGPPQPDLAVQWYQLAADQGFARAQINLGALYERGFGVPKDLVKAMDLYRRASGLQAVNVAFVPSEEIASLREERDALARQLDAERRERGRLEEELKAVRERLAKDRAALDGGQRELEAARRELAARAQATERAREQNAGEAQLATLRRELEAQRQAVEARDAQLRQVSASVAQLEGQSRTLQEKLAAAEARRVADVGAARAEAQSARAELASLGQRLRTAEDDLARSLAQMEGQRSEAARLRRELDGVQGQASQGDSRRAALEAQLKAREAELAASRARLSSLNDEVARLEKQATAAREAAARAEQAQKAAPPAASRATTRIAGLTLPPDFSFGRYHALVIGNNAYRHLQPLETAVRDARAVETLLRTRYGFKTTLLLNADRYQLLSALNKLREELTDKDNLLIYYAGHGELDRVNNRGHWLPVDAEPTSSANWISSIQVTDVVNAMSAKQILLVADSCYSGMLTRAAIASLDAGMSDEERIRWLKAMATKKARVVLSSGGVQPVLDGGGGDHSIFAAAFLAALEANNGILESAKLARTVTERVAVSDAGASIDQVPVYAPIRFAGHEAGDFFFVAQD